MSFPSGRGSQGLERWLVFLSDTEPAEARADAAFGHAFEAEEAFLADVRLYETSEAADQDDYQARAEGQEAGVEEERIRTEKRLLAGGAPVDMICCSTGKAQEIIELLGVGGEANVMNAFRAFGTGRPRSTFHPLIGGCEPTERTALQGAFWPSRKQPRQCRFE